MKILVSPDSFKGSLTALDAAQAMQKGILSAKEDFGITESIDIIIIPMADGGEGTVDAIISANHGRIIKTRVLDPLGREIGSFFGVLPDNTAVIEMAAASGLNLIKSDERNPMKTTTYGTGQLIKAALDNGCKNIIIGIGGSATNDGGAGMAQALGVKFLDKDGNELKFGGGQLNKLVRIDVSNLDTRIKDVDIVIASDVKNPLCGPEGASAVYGPQKGATLEMVKVLDQNLNHLSEVLKKDLGKDMKGFPGAGAAGGLGASIIAFLNAKSRPGIEIVMELSNYEEKVKNADLILTGEGSTDFQTKFGKVPYGVAQVAKKYNKPVICISGSLLSGYEDLYDFGITAMLSIINRPMELSEAMVKGTELLEKTTKNAVKIYFQGKLIDSIH
jgi:glycerate kinase